ncbi:MAG TPA: sulfatase [Planctomycetota bacterium]
MRGARRLAWILGAGLVVGCSRGEPEASGAGEQAGSPVPPAAGLLPEPPTIVWITIDTLRREHLSCYGYFRATTPNLDALAAEGLLFERAVSSVASTLPAHLTLLTGLYPHQHGMTSNRRGASVSYVSELGRLSLAEVLRRAGYRTAGFASATPLAAATGIGAGFETYAAPAAGAGPSLRAHERNVAVLEWLAREGPRPGPFFLWVHYFDPHEPNDPRPPYDALFTTDERQRAWIRTRGIDVEALSARFADSSRVRRHFLPPDPERQPPAPTRVTLERVADLMNRYDGEVRDVDERIGELLAALRRHGRYADAIVVVAADHGQSLGEDDWFGHGSITDVNTAVPLIVRLPAGLVAPRRIASVVSLADVAPTVLARFAVPDSAAELATLFLGQVEGEDLLSGHFTRDSALAARTADELRDGESGRQFALHAGPWKYVHRPSGEDELFDQRAGDGRDVRAEHPEVAARLLAETRALLARRSALLPDDPELAPADPELLEALEALGYGGEDDEDE